jgi:hypothetical protein
MANDEKDREDAHAAFDELQAWVERDSSARSVAAMHKLDGVWCVGVRTQRETFTQGRSSKGLAHAIRNALEIARLAGHL